MVGFPDWQIADPGSAVVEVYSFSQTGVAAIFQVSTLFRIWCSQKNLHPKNEVLAGCFKSHDFSYNSSINDAR
jgi:hypothetical protein